MIPIKKILSTVTFRQSLVTTISTFANGALGAVFYFLLARFLGSHDYGAFSVAVTLMVMIAGIVDLGTDQGLIKFVPKYKLDPIARNSVVRLTLKIKLIAGIITALVLISQSSFISQNILHKPELSILIPLVALGIIFQNLFSFSTSLSQSLERFFLWGGLYISTNIFRLALIVLVFWSGNLNGYSSTLIYILMPLLGFVLSLAFFDKKFLFTQNENRFLPELFGFNKWTTAFIIVSAMSSRLDIFFTTRYLSLSSVGIYGLALQLTTILPQLTNAIGAVTTPKFSSFSTHSQNVKYVLKVVGLNSAITLFSSLVLVPLGWFVLHTAGQDFSIGFIPFIILLSSVALFAIDSPVRDSLLYYFGKPQFFFWQGIGHALVITIFSWLLIPRFNILGSAVTVLIGQVFIESTAIIYFFTQKR